MNQITTLKIQKSTKSELDHLKKSFESYDTAIKRLVSTIKNTNMKLELIDAYKGMGKNELHTLEEWDSASNELKHHG